MVPGTPNKQFLVDVWWFPTISYIKIWFIIQVKTTICKWDIHQVPGMNQLGKSSPYFLTVLPSASLWFTPTFVSHHIDTNSDPPKKKKTHPFTTHKPGWCKKPPENRKLRPQLLGKFRDPGKWEFNPGWAIRRVPGSQIIGFSTSSFWETGEATKKNKNLWLEPWNLLDFSFSGILKTGLDTIIPTFTGVGFHPRQIPALNNQGRFFHCSVGKAPSLSPPVLFFFEGDSSPSQTSLTV